MFPSAFFGGFSMILPTLIHTELIHFQSMFNPCSSIFRWFPNDSNGFPHVSPSRPWIWLGRGGTEAAVASSGSAQIPERSELYIYIYITITIYIYIYILIMCMCVCVHVLLSSPFSNHEISTHAALRFAFLWCFSISNPLVPQESNVILLLQFGSNSTSWFDSSCLHGSHGGQQGWLTTGCLACDRIIMLPSSKLT